MSILKRLKTIYYTKFSQNTFKTKTNIKDFETKVILYLLKSS